MQALSALIITLHTKTVVPAFPMYLNLRISAGNGRCGAPGRAFHAIAEADTQQWWRGCPARLGVAAACELHHGPVQGVQVRAASLLAAIPASASMLSPMLNDEALCRFRRGLVTEYVDAVCRLDMIRPHIRKVARKVQAALANTLSNGMRKQASSVPFCIPCCDCSPLLKCLLISDSIVSVYTTSSAILMP